MRETDLDWPYKYSASWTTLGRWIRTNQGVISIWQEWNSWTHVKYHPKKNWQGSFSGELNFQLFWLLYVILLKELDHSSVHWIQQKTFLVSSCSTNKNGMGMTELLCFSQKMMLIWKWPLLGLTKSSIKKVLPEPEEILFSFLFKWLKFHFPGRKETTSIWQQPAFMMLHCKNFQPLCKGKFFVPFVGAAALLLRGKLRGT